ncbi:MAG: hypothetical protein ABI867_42605 [Kofleriaceae bacterium]
MARAVTRTWYRIALATPAGPKLFAAEGEHLGVAIGAAEDHVDHAYAIAAEIATGDQIPLGESVGKQRLVALGDYEPPALGFHWPMGVLPALGHAIPARRGYTIHDDPSLLVIEAQTDADHLVDLFLGLVERLPSADNLEIRVLDQFEQAATTDVWLTSRVDAKKIIRFLDDHDVELIGNGHVELSVYVRSHKATLKLTEHKTVVWLAEGGGLRDDVVTWMKELEVPVIDPLVTITAAPHFHYRPAKSKDRAKLSDHLFRQRLRRVDKVAKSS